MITRLGLLLLIVGFVNSVITSLLWFPVKVSFWRILFHGMLLFIALLVVNGIFVVAPSLVFTEFATTIITLVVGSILSGFAGKKVAEWWREEAQKRYLKR